MVHVFAESKYKQNYPHLANLFNQAKDPVRTETLRQLTAANFDFRILYLLKNELFDSPDLQDQRYVSTKVWADAMRLHQGEKLQSVEN